MAIADLPEITDLLSDIPPVFDKQVTDSTSLFLKNDALQNPNKGGLVKSISNLTKAKSALGGLAPGDVKKVRNYISSSSALSWSDPALRQKAIDSLDKLTNVSAKVDSALGSTTRFLDHTNLATENLPALGGIVNDVIATPSKFVSDVAGGLPSSFPTRLPSFNLGADKLPIPDFAGTTLPAIPKFDIPEITVPGLPSFAAGMEGVNVPGIPNPDDVLSKFAGSVTLPEFGGVGTTLSEGMANLSGVAGDLAGNVAGKINAALTAITPTDALDGLPGLPTIVNMESIFGGPDGIGDLEALGLSMDGLGGAGGGMSDVTGGEAGAIFGAVCANFAPGANCGGVPSIAAAASMATAIKNGLMKTQTTAKLVASTATKSLKKVFPDELLPQG